MRRYARHRARFLVTWYLCGVIPWLLLIGIGYGATALVAQMVR